MNFKKMFKIKPNWVCIAITVVIILVLFRITSGYKNDLNYLDIQVEAAPGSGDEFAIQNLPSDIKCVPSSEETADYYTRGLTPGGICGGQKYVNASADYKITGGIGGSLLERNTGDEMDSRLSDF
jgi:hypothetical protein